MSKPALISLLRKLAEVSFAPMLQKLQEDSVLEILAAQSLMKLSSSYIPWSRAALSHRGIAIILNDIIFNQRTTIVELGSGISTVYISKLLQQIGRGHLYSIEQDTSWVDTIAKIVQNEKMGEYVTFIHAPVSKYSETLTIDGQWYNENLIIQNISSSIDTLIVDGPADDPQTPDPLIRYPALPAFVKLLSLRCSVFIDDATRKGEQEVIGHWERELGVKFRRAGKIAFAFRGEHYKPFT